ncbi:undecaprenyl-diphosphate phosphatase [Patescibacteria group bacterium]|nr:undecaprenyl-diphosphate phosphatase [Patescibacteria group bacterium]
MHYIFAVILSIVEGISEFLPISSTGHLILASDILRIPQTDFQKSFEIFIQLGAILSVVLLYRDTLLHSIKVWERVLIAFIPTGILGLTLFKLIKNYLLGNTSVVLTSLFLGGIALIILEKLHKEKDFHIEEMEKITYKQAFLIGLFQSIAMVPGVSRSAATIFGGLYLGLKRKTAVEFSFLLAVPTMVAATGLDLVKSHAYFTSQEFILLSIGFIGSFITAYMTIKYFLKYIKTHNFIQFGVYRIVMSLAFWFLVVR